MAVELTMEDNTCGSGSKFPAAYRYGLEPTAGGEGIGSRAQLYVNP